MTQNVIPCSVCDSMFNVTTKSSHLSGGQLLPGLAGALAEGRHGGAAHLQREHHRDGGVTAPEGGSGVYKGW